MIYVSKSKNVKTKNTKKAKIKTTTKTNFKRPTVKELHEGNATQASLGLTLEADHKYEHTTERGIYQLYNEDYRKTDHDWIFHVTKDGKIIVVHTNMPSFEITDSFGLLLYLNGKPGIWITKMSGGRLLCSSTSKNIIVKAHQDLIIRNIPTLEVPRLEFAQKENWWIVKGLSGYSPMFLKEYNTGDNDSRFNLPKEERIPFRLHL